MILFHVRLLDYPRVFSGAEIARRPAGETRCMLHLLHRDARRKSCTADLEGYKLRGVIPWFMPQEKAMIRRCLTFKRDPRCGKADPANEWDA
jgi:hypothetical protein